MRKLGILLALCTVEGCASVDELRKQEPFAHFVISKSNPQAAASCISGAWNDQHIGIEANGATVRRDGNQFVVVSPASGTPSEVAVVTSVSDGSSVSIYSQASIDVGGRTRKRVDSAKTCM